MGTAETLAVSTTLRTLSDVAKELELSSVSLQMTVVSSNGTGFIQLAPSEWSKTVHLLCLEPEWMGQANDGLTTFYRARYKGAEITTMLPREDEA